MSPESFGKYPVSKLIGRGALALVFLAHDPAFDRAVAIKVIYPHLARGADFADRFRREAKLVAALRHAHIIQLYDFDVQNGEPFLVMEYLDAGTLADRLASLRTRGLMMPRPEIAAILEPVAGALDYAHTNGVVHRDFKPANILFTPKGDPVITDFGIAKIVSESAPMTIVGSPAYLSPEQAAGKSVDARSDVYALGIIAYEMVTGRVPFQGDTPMAVLQQQIAAPPPAPGTFQPGIAREVETVILRALEKEPTRRFATAGEFARAFGAALRGEKPAPLPQPAGQSRVLNGLGMLAEISAPLIGRSAPDVSKASTDHRSQVATVLGIIGVLFAVLQFIINAFDLISRPIAPLVAALPFVIAALFVGGAGLSAFVAVRSTSAANRKRAALLLGFILVVGLVWGGWTLYDRLTPPGKFVVAVADFDYDVAKTKDPVDLARRIYQQLKNDLSDAGGDVDVQRTLAVYKDSAEARARGIERKAMMVIWGWYDSRGVSPSVELLQVPALQREIVSVPILWQSEGGGLAKPRLPRQADLAKFVRVPKTITDMDLFVKNGPQQMTYISTGVLGLAFYVNGDSARALALFDKALANASAGGTDIVGTEQIYFHRAIVMYQQDRMNDAAADLQQALTIKPDYYEAHYNLALMYSEMCTPARRLDRAIAEADAAVRLRPNEASSHWLLGDLYRQARQYDQALVEALKATAADPNDAAALDLLAAVQSALGHEEAAKLAQRQAVGLREKAVSSAQDPAQAHMDLGAAYVNNSDPARAIAEYRAALTLAPNSAPAHRGLGNAYYWQKDFTAAEREYRRALEIDPKDTGLRILLALMYMEQNKTAAAQGELEQAIKISPCLADAHLLLGNLYFNAGDNAQAMTAYQAVVGTDPQNADAWYMLGAIQYLAHEYDAATQSLQTAVTLRRDFTLAYSVLGAIHYDQRDYAQAARERELLVKLAPNEAYYWEVLGNAYDKLGRAGDAIAAYRKSLTLQDEARVHIYLGGVYNMQGQFDQAIAEIKQALVLDPRNPLAFTGLGFALVQQNKLAEAATAYRQALDLDDSGLIHFQLAGVYVRQGNADAALAEYRKSLASDPKNVTAHVQMGNLFKARGELDEATTAYRAALALQSGNLEAHSGLVGVEYKRCNLNGAVQEQTAVLAQSTNKLAARIVLAGLYGAQGRADDADKIYADLRTASDWLSVLVTAERSLATGQLSEAASALQTLLETPNLPPAVTALVHSDLGTVYWQQDKLVAAASEFNLALAANPNDANAQTALGDIAQRQGDASAALAAYDRAVALLPAYAVQNPDGAAPLAVWLQVRRALAWSRQGRSSDANGALDQATTLAQGLVSRTPQWPVAHYALGIAYLAHGDPAQADAEFAAAGRCDATFAGARARVEQDLAKLK